MRRAELFEPVSFFRRSDSTYQLLPFRFGRIPGIAGEVLVTSDSGEYHFVSQSDFDLFVGRQLSPSSPTYAAFRRKKLLADEAFDADTAIRLDAARLRTKKSFLAAGPSLHIVVPTLRCDHSCPYCQVSRQSVDKTRFDIPERLVEHVVNRVFESRSPRLTVEFQGGEPLLAFDRIKRVIEAVEQRNESAQRDISFVVATTLHFATAEILNYFAIHHVRVSTSLDGPEWLHNVNRPNRSHDSFKKTIAGIERARRVLGTENVAALLTLTKNSLSHPREIIDTYLENGFRSIFLRPLSPFGFATRSSLKIGYSTEEFLSFYEAALDYLIELNGSGTYIEEAFAALILGHILTPFPSAYVDLRSPCGAALDVLVYNYDGRVYASDEARMLAEMGNSDYALGHVTDSYDTLYRSAAMERLMAGAVAESLPGCSDCVYLPYCGADPVYSVASQGDPIGHRPTSHFCKRQTGLFRLFFRHLRNADPRTMSVFMSWLSRRPIPSQEQGAA